MGNIGIDFKQATIISDNIGDKINDVDNIITQSSSISSLFHAIPVPSQFISDVNDDIETMNDNIRKISTMVSNLQNNFDRSVNSYYLLEKGDYDILSDTLVAGVNNFVSSKTSNSNNSSKFTWGYKNDPNGITRVSSEEMTNYLLSKGATPVQNVKNHYNITIDGIKYRYDVANNKLYIGNECFKCDFYVSNNYKNTEISNVVTLLGGTGEDAAGAVKNGKISQDIPFSNDGLLIVPYSGVQYQYISTDATVASTRFGEHVFNVSDNCERSIIGFSEGSLVMTTTVSKNPGLYDNVAYVNGASYNAIGYSNYSEKFGYEGFKNANIYYIETEAGWPAGLNNGNANTNQVGVTRSIESLVNNGVDPNKITLITNDDKLVSTVNSLGINIDSSMPQPVRDGNKMKYYNHGDGAWDIFNESGILNYLSTN